MKKTASKLIDELQELISEDENIDLFVEKIHELVGISSISQVSTYKPGIELYRTTNHHTCIPINISDLWYPPERFANPNRANRKGNPMFYCSSDPTCTFLELGLELNQLYVHAKWITTQDMMLHDLGFIEDVFKRAGTKRDVPKENQQFEESNITNIHKYIYLAFTEEKNPKYDLTAAIAEVHLRADFINGIKYPAIKKGGNVDNIALVPDYVRNSLTLETAQLVKVDELTRDNSVSGEIIADLQEVKEDGELIWKFREEGDDLGPSEGAVLKTGVTTIQSSGKIIVYGNVYMIERGYTIENKNNNLVTVRNLKGEIVEPISLNE